MHTTYIHTGWAKILDTFWKLKKKSSNCHRIVQFGQKCLSRSKVLFVNNNKKVQKFLLTKLPNR